MADAFGADRRAAVCRELTKTYEEVVRGTLAELADWAADEVRGEVTLVVEGAPASTASYTPEELRSLVESAEATGLSRKDAVAEIARRTGVRRSEVYSAAH
jgi:16S rRNA (cytidine1402-2'-O)-methyltransferase